MMKRMNAPFILIADPRIEGGAFYLGSENYEQSIRKVIQNALDYLGFANNQLILSGLSMGSFGALYYATKLNPAAVIVGKPLINLGTIANNMKLVRPNDFGTSLDILRLNQNDITNKDVVQLDNHFWKQIQHSDLSMTTFAIAYMEHDDYDKYAFQDLLPVLTKQHARVISKRIPGRHNDDSATVTHWFINFYHLIMEERFGRVTHAKDRKFEVKWRLVNSSTFMYGTKLRFNQDNIYFENPLMPSGTIIHSWYMLTDFAEDRVSPKLPILKRAPISISI